MQNAEMAHAPRASVAPPSTGDRPDRQPTANLSETPNKKQRSSQSKAPKIKKNRFAWLNSITIYGFTLREVFFLLCMISPLSHTAGLVLWNYDTYIHSYAFAYQQVTGAFPDLSNINVFLTGWSFILFDVFALTMCYFAAFKEHAKIVALLLCGYVFVTYGGAL